MFLYRIISIIVNIFCAFVALATLWGLVLALANPVFLFQCFITAGTALYAWFANRFYHTVVVAKKTMTKKQKDLLQVNAIVALIFSLLGISNTITLLTHPKMRDEMLSAMPANISIPQSTITNVAVFMLVICIILLVHIAMTYALIKKHKEYFETGS